MTNKTSTDRRNLLGAGAALLAGAELASDSTANAAGMQPYGVEGGLRYSETTVLETRLKTVAENYSAALTNLKDRLVIPFNQMAEWGANGRIKKEAAVHSPFVRHRQHLALESAGRDRPEARGGYRMAYWAE